jgi:hypothetical protein
MTDRAANSSRFVGNSCRAIQCAQQCCEIVEIKGVPGPLIEDRTHPIIAPRWQRFGHVVGDKRQGTATVTCFCLSCRHASVWTIDGEDGGKVGDDGRLIVAGAGGSVDLATGGDRSRWRVVLPLWSAETIVTAVRDGEGGWSGIVICGPAAARTEASRRARVLIRSVHRCFFFEL